MSRLPSAVYLLPGLFFAVLAGNRLSAAEESPAKIAYDFEDATSVKAWSNSAPSGGEGKASPVKIEQSAEGATSGKQCLKLTFTGGEWPTVGTDAVSQDWLAYKSFKADVTATRPCVVGFTLLQEKSLGGDGWEAVISRWTTTAFLKAGKNEVVASLLQNNDYALHAKWGKVVRFEIFLYDPRDGESIAVDNIRMGHDKIPARDKVKMAIAGTDWTVSGGSVDGCRELGRNVAHLWNKPAAKSVAEIEEEFRAKLVDLKKRHPKAVLAILRDGEKGYDPAAPEKVYAGWTDAYWNSHGPDTAYAERAKNRGAAASHEIFMRHRSPLMRVDLGSIPKGSTILAAQLVVVKTSEKILDDYDPAKRPTMWVVEPCNRPWVETEVNAFQYAKGKFWKDIGGFHTGEADPDFLPMFLAFGPGRPGKVNAWDFAQAVRFWTDGRRENCGFMLHGDAGDYMTAHTREAKKIENRPAIFAIYVPK
jgi:hypothetical protein